MSAFAPLCPLFSSDDGDDENSDETPVPPPPSPKFSQAMFFEMMEVFDVLKSSGAAIGPSVYKKYVNLIVIEAIPLLQAEPNILNLESKNLTVLGDIHGHFFDLQHVFEHCGFPNETDNVFLFAGDMVDRGDYSVEVILTLLGLKVLFPSGIYLLRGNHESYPYYVHYGFIMELQGKLSSEHAEVCVQMFEGVFRALPLAALVDGCVFITHGGIPRASRVAEHPLTIADIANLERFEINVDTNFALKCLLWNDPQRYDGFAFNRKRSIGELFGPDILDEFLSTNGLRYMIRAHEVVPKGWEDCSDGQRKCFTVFSAPKYAGGNNQGAYLKFGPDLQPLLYSYQDHITELDLRTKAQVEGDAMEANEGDDDEGDDLSVYQPDPMRCSGEWDAEGDIAVVDDGELKRGGGAETSSADNGC